MGSPVYTVLIGAGVQPIQAIQAWASGTALRRSRPVGRRTHHRHAALAAVALLALGAVTAAAHETDQSTLPLGREFADLRVPLSHTVRDAITEAVNNTNAAIKSSLRNGHPIGQTAQLQSADRIAGEVWAQLFAAFPTNEGLDIVLANETMRARYPGLVTVYRPEQYVYDDPLLLLDVTKVVRTLFRSATINVDGTLFGTDKIIHFVHLGRIYHSSYLGARKRGAGEAEAVSGAVQLSAGGNLFLSESTFLGMLTTGIRSNADLAANYAGFKFYRNLTETVRIGDKILPPMLVRAGPYWQLDQRVRDEPDFFAAFVTPHWNEVLNPNSYAVLVDSRVRTMLRDRCPDVLAGYRDERGQVRSREQFARLAQDLSTYYGENYGYRDDGKNTVSVTTTCFAAQPPGGPAPGPATAAGERSRSPDAFPQLTMGQGPRDPAATDRRAGPSIDRFGRTRLWWAARDGRLTDVERLLAGGEDPNAADLDGETPLHAAARWGHAAVIERLLAWGADSEATALYGMTPLHVAVEESQLGATRALLESGSDVEARDIFGASPLHQAAAQGNHALATMLLAYGADPGAVDDNATTPPQLAARAGNQALVKLLSSAAAGHSAGRTVDPATDAGASAPEHAAILRVSTDTGVRRPAQPASRADAAAPASP